MSEDEIAYRRSVRNMAVVLSVIVVTIFAAIFLPPLLNPAREQFAASTSTTSPYGFTLNLRLNSTSLKEGGAVSITAWLNSTSPALDNVTASSAWAIGQVGLWTRPCYNGWPLGVGVMRGYYTAENYTLGSVIRIPSPLVSCPVTSNTPSFFIFQPFSSNALVETGGTATVLNLRTALTFVPVAAGPGSSGVYTVICADEWGDVVIAHFVSA